MIYLPAAAGRTTKHLRRTGITSGVICGTLVIVIVAVEIYSAGGHGAGAHRSLYSAAVLAAVVSASCLSFAFARTLIAQSTAATTAELARVLAKLDAQDETLRQVVAELARARATIWDLGDEQRETRATMARWVRGPSGATVVQMPAPDSMEAARSLARRMIASEGRRMEDNSEDIY